MDENIDYSEILKRLKLTEKDLDESKEKELQKTRRGLNLIQIVLWFLGFAIVWYNTNFFVVLGIWFIIWSNNINLTRAILGKRKNYMEKIWKDK